MENLSELCAVESVVEPIYERYDRFDRTLDYMYNQMMNNPYTREGMNIQSFTDSPPFLPSIPGGYQKALLLWEEQVQTGGSWDHKWILDVMLHLNESNDYYFPIRGDNNSTREIYYDIWANIHYGYVGKSLGITSRDLRFFATLGTPATGTNDLGDEITVDIGIILWDDYGPNLTKQQLQQAINLNLDRLEDKAVYGKNMR